MTIDLYEDARTTPPSLPVPQRVLAIGAHPDDVEFGAGGTLATWIAAGCAATIAVVTDGSKGTWDRTLDPADLAARRRDEQHAAAAALGGAEVLFFDLIDGEVEATMALRQRVCEVIRRTRPDVVLTHDPWRRYQLHPDHRATGWSVVDGVVAARDHLFFPEQVAAGLEPHRPSSLMLWSADEPDHWEDIGPVFELKIAALLCHSSQSRTTMGDAGADEHHRAAFETRMRTWAADLGRPAGLSAAEAFKRLQP